MNVGRTTGKNEVTKASVAKGLLEVLGIGLASGLALIASTNAIMSKLFPQKDGEETKEEK